MSHSMLKEDVARSVGDGTKRLPCVSGRLVSSLPDPGWKRQGHGHPADAEAAARETNDGCLIPAKSRSSAWAAGPRNVLSCNKEVQGW